MATANSAVKKAEQTAKQAVDPRTVERLIRFGFIMRGVLYIVIGLVALGVAVGTQSTPKDATGALQVIGSQPYGKLLLVLMALGLAAYSIWGLIRAVWDPLHRGRDANGLMDRLGYLWSAIAYGSLILPALQLSVGVGGGANSNQTAQSQDLTARLLRNPYGHWLVILFGLIVIGVGVGQLYYAYKEKFLEDLNLRNLKAEQKQTFIRIGRAGYAARGVVFLLIGIFFVQAAVTYDPHKARGLDGALLALMQQPYGPILLGLVALGLLLFGVYSVIASRYAKVDVPV